LLRSYSPKANTISIPESVELFRGLKAREAGEKKKKGTFKAEILTESLSVSEENIFTTVYSLQWRNPYLNQ